MKLFARRVASKGSGKKRKRRLGLKLLLVVLFLGLCFGLISFYGIWAQTFDLKQVGHMIDDMHRARRSCHLGWPHLACENYRSVVSRVETDLSRSDLSIECG